MDDLNQKCILCGHEKLYHDPTSISSRAECRIRTPPFYIQCLCKGLFRRTAAEARDPDGENLGRLVRETWIAWAKEQPSPKESWLVPWESLSEADRDVDRRIGIRIRDAVLSNGQPKAIEHQMNSKPDHDKQSAKVSSQFSMFEASLPTLLDKHRDEWVVWLDGPKSFHPTEQAALRSAYATLPDDAAFVVAKVAPIEVMNAGPVLAGMMAQAEISRWATAVKAYFDAAPVARCIKLVVSKEGHREPCGAIATKRSVHTVPLCDAHAPEDAVDIDGSEETRTLLAMLKESEKTL